MAFFDLLTGLFQQTGVVPDIVQHVGMPYAVLAMVDAGLGAALVPESAWRFAPPDVHFLPIELPPHMAIELHVAWRRANDNPALPPLLDCVRRLGINAASMQDLDRKAQ